MPRSRVTVSVIPLIHRWAFHFSMGCLLLLCIGLARAEQAVQDSLSTNVESQDPQVVVRQAVDQVLEVLRLEGDQLSQDPERLHALVDGILVEQMDFERMSRWVLGKYWRSATVQQQARFVAEFRGLLVRTYATALANYNGQEVTYLPLRESRVDNQIVVRSEIRQPAAPPIAVNYSLYLRHGQWKVYDVSIDGISLVANYRASFTAEVRARGIDGLINSLAGRNQQAHVAH